MIDDIGEILRKLPPIEKLFGGAWIISWFLAIWIYHIQFFLTGLFCLFLAILLLGYFDEKTLVEVESFLNNPMEWSSAHGGTSSFPAIE